MTNIFERAAKTLPAEFIDHHETDLYIKVTPESKALVREYDYRSNVETFRDQITGTLWFDIPFAYTPGWDRANRWPYGG